MTHKGILFILIIAFLEGCTGRNKDLKELSSGPVPVVTTKVLKVSSGKVISLSGNIEGNKTLRLGFLVAGKIDFISANEGELVKKGQLISSLDPTNYSIAKELADIQVSQVQDEYDRLKLMHDRNSLSESDFTKITYGLQQARAQQKLHTKNLSDTRLFCPINGVLLKKLCEVGEITGVGIPLFIVSDISKIKVTAFIPENELNEIKIGQDAEIMVSSLNKISKGRITEVGSAADPASRAFTVRIELDNPGLLIRPGMIAEIKIMSGKNEEFLAVPSASLIHDFNDMTYVFVADTLKNIVNRRNIIPGRIKDNNVEALSGINEHELVVITGQQRLVNGSSITIER